MLLGGRDDDRILARDGWADRVECGRGSDHDTVMADLRDLVVPLGCAVIDTGPPVDPTVPV